MELNVQYIPASCIYEKKQTTMLPPLLVFVCHLETPQWNTKFKAMWFSLDSHNVFDLKYIVFHKVITRLAIKTESWWTAVAGELTASTLAGRSRAGQSQQFPEIHKVSAVETACNWSVAWVCKSKVIKLSSLLQVNSLITAISIHQDEVSPF